MMRKLVFLTGLVLLSMFSSIASASCTVSGVKASDRAWIKATNKHKLDILDRFFSKDATFTGAYQQEPVLTPEDRHTYFVSLFKDKPNLKVHFNKNNIKLFDSVAVSSGLCTIEWQKKGKLLHKVLRYTFVYQCTKDGYKFINYHVSTSLKK